MGLRAEEVYSLSLLPMKPFPVVLFNMSYYVHWGEGTLNRNWFIAHELLRDGRVEKLVHVDFIPYSITSCLRSVAFTASLIGKHELVTHDPLSALFKVSEREHLIIAPIAYLSRMFFVKRLARYLAALGVTPRALSWSYNPLDLTFLNNKFFTASLFDAVDDWRYHAAFARFRQALNRNYGAIASRASIVVSVSTYLKELFRERWGREALVVPNGVDLSYGTTDVAFRAHRSMKRVVYLGTIEERLDIPLVNSLARSRKDVQFELIGPIWKSVRRKVRKSLCSLPNVLFLGRKPYAEARKLLGGYDVAIIPHRKNPFTASNDPLKAYDYLAAGLPVVSTVPIEDADIAPCVTVADRDRFGSALERVLAGGSSNRKECREAILRACWKNRAERILSAVERLGF
jgi:hypothetical protein